MKPGEGGRRAHAMGTGGVGGGRGRVREGGSVCGGALDRRAGLGDGGVTVQYVVSRVSDSTNEKLFKKKCSIHVFRGADKSRMRRNFHVVRVVINHVLILGLPSCKRLPTGNWTPF